MIPEFGNCFVNLQKNSNIIIQIIFDDTHYGNKK